MTENNDNIEFLIDDIDTANKIKDRLPRLFQIAEQESSRAGKMGMEVGVLRERIIIALLIHVFGDDNVETNIPSTEKETDVEVFDYPISIKTITGTGGIKAIWTVDAAKALEFCNNYQPKADSILVQIRWDNYGKFYFIPLSVQSNTFKTMGPNNYFKLPKKGTNPRPVCLIAARHVVPAPQKGSSTTSFWKV